MSEWKEVKLGECITTKKGFAFKSALYTPKGVPVVRVSDFTLNSITDKDLVYYPVSEYNNYKDYVLTEKDILVQTVGSWQYNPNSVVGKVVRVPYYHQGSLLNQNIVKIIPIECIDKDYLYYRIKCVDFSGYVIGEARGAANQASITLDTIKRFAFLLPPKDVQERIGATLSRYDSLIENYQRQIKLLEEAAQRLYKEWFVDLHFPGYETTKIIDGVPEGWEMKTIDDVTCKVTTGLNPRKNFVLGKGSNYYVTIKNMADNSIFLDDRCDRVDNEALEKINKRSDLKIGDILFSGIGTIGRVALIDIPTNNWNVSESVFTMRANEIITKEYLYFVLLSSDMQNYCQSNAHGAAQKGIRMADLKAYCFDLPPYGIVQKFTSLVTPTIKKVSSIRNQIRLLTEARDRLLPKLMSGEIDV